MFNGLPAQWQRTTSCFDSAIQSSAISFAFARVPAETATARCKSGPSFILIVLKLSVQLSEMTFERLGDLILGNRANNLFHHLAVFEDQQRGDTPNAVTRGGIHRLVHV